MPKHRAKDIEPAEPIEQMSEEQAPDLAAELEAEHERFLRLAAEYDNYRKRTQKEREGLFKTAIAATVEALLPTYDNLERAMNAETSDETYKRGVEMTMNQLIEAFEKLGVKEIPAERGTPFDPSIHNAVLRVEDEELEVNVIAEVFQKGFAIGDVVIRHTVCKTAN